MSPHYSKLLEKLKREESIQTNQWNRFVDCLTHEDVDMGTLLQLSYASLHGQGFWILDDLRSLAWQLLLGYLPLTIHLHMSMLERKRSEY
ncbi:hypothetical protein BC834DRAFT_972860 [Gloeopeniophorella convolvens]|nr:hypothetical protein BC834DRAFT_972860 [Gloeopeniophorella convolvens]